MIKKCIVFNSHLSVSNKTWWEITSGLSLDLGFVEGNEKGMKIEKKKFILNWLFPFLGKSLHKYKIIHWIRK